MPDESIENTSEQSIPQPSPLQLVDTVIRLLRVEMVAADEVVKLLEQLASSIGRQFDAWRTDVVYEDAIERAPWCTGNAERLKKQQSEILQSVKVCCGDARNCEMSANDSRMLITRLSEFAECFSEYESAVEEFIQTAFPGPEWTTGF